ncbi:MAG: porin [Gammaproteobacteria bacterium]|nr:porin [Gammaproteobacteria bacterium]MBU1776487.1 porin [Gammaproteobacteria bacterium]MBU1969862.1 porin [Gammaproteobacteria bacterium]
MQKKLIALAVTAAFSTSAFAEATVYGIVDAAVASISATGMKSDIRSLSGGLSGSRIGVVAAEDLDNGMKAIAKIEYKLDSQLSDGVLAARQEMLALAGGFGTVAAGYLQTTGYDWQGMFDPASGSQVSPLTRVNSGFLIGSGAAAARAQNALAYISPDLGGVTVAVNYTTDFANTGMVASGTTSGNKTTATLLSATYKAGPLAVGGVYAGTANDDTGYAKTTDMAVGASYDLGAAKLMGTYQTNKTDTTGATTQKAMSFSVVAPVGPGAVVGSYAKNSMSGTGNDDNSMTVAYLQGLSKTTTAYGAVHKINTKTANVAADTTIVVVGLKKTF